MHDIWLSILTAWQAQSYLEIVAVVTAVLYLLLAIRENIWCWLFAAISTGISVYIFLDINLLSESLLNIFYFIMAFYGWYQWINGSNKSERKITSWSLKKHLYIILLTAAMVPVLGFTTELYGASMPYLDAFTTCFAVLATFMVAHKVLENWHYWMIVNTTSVYIYASNELYLFSAMYVLYMVLTVMGYINWNKHYANQKSLA